MKNAQADVFNVLHGFAVKRATDIVNLECYGSLWPSFRNAASNVGEVRPALPRIEIMAKVCRCERTK